MADKEPQGLQTLQMLMQVTKTSRMLYLKISNRFENFHLNGKYKINLAYWGKKKKNNKTCRILKRQCLKFQSPCVGLTPM